VVNEGPVTVFLVLREGSAAELEQVEDTVQALRIAGLSIFSCKPTYPVQLQAARGGEFCASVAQEESQGNS
jgi:hypothetical protein